MKQELSYAGKKTPSGKTGSYLYPVTFVLLAFTLMAITTSVRIEILNAQYGYYLPRDMKTHPGPWRIGMELTEARWRESESYADPTIVTRPLTPAEETRMHAAMEQSRLHNELGNLVGSWGVLQYPLVFVLLIALFFIFIFHKSRAWRFAILASWIATLVCASFMIHRDYWGSLGI